MRSRATRLLRLAALLLGLVLPWAPHAGALAFHPDDCEHHEERRLPCHEHETVAAPAVHPGADAAVIAPASCRCHHDLAFDRAPVAVLAEPIALVIEIAPPRAVAPGSFAGASRVASPDTPPPIRTSS